MTEPKYLPMVCPHCDIGFDVPKGETVGAKCYDCGSKLQPMDRADPRIYPDPDGLDFDNLGESPDY